MKQPLPYTRPYLIGKPLAEAKRLVYANGGQLIVYDEHKRRHVYGPESEFKVKVRVRGGLITQVQGECG